MKRFALLALCLSIAAGLAPAGASPQAVPARALSDGEARALVARAVAPVMKRYGIPGMAIGISVGGRHYVCDFGLASKATGRRVEDSTLFEIGSIAKTFTASLTSYAELTGRLSLEDEVSAAFPPLRGTSFDRVRLVDLATHTSGGLPLQFPDGVRSDADAMSYYRHWKPSHPAGTYRLYSNTGIMLLGVVAAHRLGGPFETLMQRNVFAPLGLHDTYLEVPAAASLRYAQGYTDAGKPRRMSPGPLAPEAYGIRTTAPDMLRFIDANMAAPQAGDVLLRAIRRTHTGYYRIGAMTQDLVWEQYRYPLSLSDVLRGNSDDMIFEANPAAKLDPPLPPGADVLIDKTGSTSGFAAYVAFAPERKIGIVLLANRSYPIAARVAAAYRILTALVRGE
jgi:beta-lactamase class C